MPVDGEKLKPRRRIPLFGELAYLLPQLNLTLIMISPSVKKICDKAKKEYPNSIISKAPKHGPCPIVYEANPKGFGRIRVALFPTAQYFHDNIDDIPSSGGGVATRFDGVIGLNAGLASYESWKSTLSRLIIGKYRFVFSDQSMATMNAYTQDLLPKLAVNECERPPLPKSSLATQG